MWNVECGMSNGGILTILGKDERRMRKVECGRSNGGILSILWKDDGRWMKDDERMVEFLGMTNVD